MSAVDPTTIEGDNWERRAACTCNWRGWWHQGPNALRVANADADNHRRRVHHDPPQQFVERRAVKADGQ